MEVGCPLKSKHNIADKIYLPWAVRAGNSVYYVTTTTVCDTAKYFVKLKCQGSESTAVGTLLAA